MPKVRATQREKLLDKKLADEPIILPGNPIWEIFKDFGRDELIALAINTLSVGALSTLTTNPVLLAVGGPVLEKIGFFANSSKKAFDVYRTTPEEQRNPKKQYLFDAIKNGTPNLLRDLILHDPLYTGLLLLEFQQFPETPAWMLSVIAFLLSVGAVAGGEVAVKEMLYKLQTERLKGQGFTLEKHLESKFIVKNIPSQDLLSELAEYFELGEIRTSNYHDTYYPTSLKTFNSREPAVRIRRRREDEDGEEPDTIQVVYTRVSELRNKHPGQFNYFPVAKDKFQLPLTHKTNHNLNRVVLPGEAHEIFFDRDYAHIPGKMLISTDQVHDGENSYSVVEVKSFRDQKDAVNMMVMAMRHIMSKYDVVQTTHSKRALTSLR